MPRLGSCASPLRPAARRPRLAAALSRILPALAMAGPVIAQAAAVPPAVEAVLRRYCVTCHGGDDPEGDVRLDTLATLPPAERPEVLARVREVVQFDEMPPDDEPQPEPAAYTPARR